MEPHLANIDPKWANLGQVLSILSEFGPKCDQHWPTVGLFGPNLGRYWPNIGRTRRRFANSARIGRISAPGTCVPQLTGNFGVTDLLCHERSLHGRRHITRGGSARDVQVGGAVGGSTRLGQLVQQRKSCFSQPLVKQIQCCNPTCPPPPFRTPPPSKRLSGPLGRPDHPGCCLGPWMVDSTLRNALRVAPLFVEVGAWRAQNNSPGASCQTIV